MSRRGIWHRASPFGSHVLLTAGTNVVLALLGLLTGIMAARLLGPQGRGELAAIQIWPSAIAVVAMLGLGDALVYFSARDPERSGRYLGSAIALALVSAFPFMLVGYLGIPFLLSAQSSEVIASARWYLILVPIFALVGMPYHPLRGRNDWVTWNALRVTPTLGWLAVLILAWSLGLAQPVFVAASYLVVLATLFFPVIFTVTRRVPGPFRPEVSRWGQMLRYGLPSVASSLPRMLNFRLDQMLMAAFLPAGTLGLYVVAVSWSSAVHPLPNALGAVLFPRVASQQIPEQRTEVFAQGSRLGVSVSATMALALMALTPFGIPLLFGAEFAAAIPAALVLAVAGAVAGVNLILEEGLRGLGHPASVMRAELGGLAVSAASLAILLGPLGIMGAALASLLGYGAVALLLVVAARRLTGHSSVALLRPRFDEIRSGWKQTRALLLGRSKDEGAHETTS